MGSHCVSGSSASQALSKFLIFLQQHRKKPATESSEPRPPAHLFLGVLGFNLRCHLHSSRASAHHHDGL